jgi:hypothetical protein
MVGRLLVVVMVLGACGGGGGNNNNTPHNVTVAVNGPGHVTSTPTGIDCPAACSDTFTDHVTLYAQADTGAMFVGWSGACSGSDPSCALELSSDQSATAMFAPAGNETLTVSIDGPGSVHATMLDCPGSNCMQSYAPGTMVMLTATPDASASFSGWAGDCTGTGTCTVTMDQARTVMATFAGAAGMHMLSVSVTGPGTVTSAPAGINCSSGTCTAMFNSTDTVTLQETPNGSTFSMWGGDCSGSGSCSVAMSQDRTVDATFASSGYVLAVHLQGDGTGTVTSSPSGINCTSGSLVGCSYDFGPSSGPITLTATPATGSSFAGQGVMGNFGCNADNYGNPCTYSLNNNGLAVDVAFSGWTGRFPFPSSLTGLAMIGTSYVAVGAGGNAITSTNDTAGGNGAFWTGRPAPAALNAVAVQGTTWFAARDGGHVAASPDGIVWTDYAAGTADLRGIASSGTQLVAVGKTGAIEYSSNGIAWNAATSGTTAQLNEVIYTGTQFVAIGYAGTILTSPDGVTWTARTSGTTNVLYGIAYDASMYVIVGASGVVLTSSDGVTWTKPTTTGLPVSALHGVAWTGSRFLAAGDPFDSNSGHTLAYASPDGIIWTAYVTAMNNDAATRVVAPGDGYTYLLGSSGSLQRTNNLTSWSLVLAPGGRNAPGMGQTNMLMSIAYNGSMWVAGGQWGSLFTSPDAVTWTSRRAAPCCDFITGIEWGAGLTNPVFAAVGTINGGANYILTSPDGVTWTKVFPTSGVVAGNSAGIAYGGPTKGFSAVGWRYNGSTYEGLAITSIDGATWASSATAATDISASISSITYGNGLFVATGFTVNGAMTAGAVYTSSDGSAWTAQSFTGNIGAVAYGNGVFTGFDAPAMGVWTSADAAQWTRSAVTFTPGAALAFGNGVFYNSALYTSPNGTTWTQVSRLPDISEINGGVFNAARYGASTWVGVNSDEMIVTHP